MILRKRLRPAPRVPAGDDEALYQGWQVPVDAAPTGKRVLVVGAGPSGLSAAYHLTRLGRAVTVKEAAPHPVAWCATGYRSTG